MYFRQFENGYYDLKGDGKQKLVVDLNRVRKNG